LDDDVRGRVARVHRRLDAVSEVLITRKDFRSVQLHRNNRFYDFLLRLCLLIHDQLIPDPEAGTGRTRFRDFRDDEARMWEIFEQFVHNFFRREQQEFHVRAQRVVAWHCVHAEPDHLARLPEMRPDLVLEGADRCIVLDTKFYKEALKGRGAVAKINSGHLYQLFTYVHNRAAAHGNQPAHEGMLLYPVVRDTFGFDYRIAGFRFQVRSIDLGQEWRKIHEDMLALLN
jgi:5-methylcytosine-specific restriction enzyme subunit McrC